VCMLSLWGTDVPEFLTRDKAGGSRSLIDPARPVTQSARPDAAGGEGSRVMMGDRRHYLPNSRDLRRIHVHLSGRISISMLAGHLETHVPQRRAGRPTSQKSRIDATLRPIGVECGPDPPGNADCPAWQFLPARSLPSVQWRSAISAEQGSLPIAGRRPHASK
jgi:hypothetical protein